MKKQIPSIVLFAILLFLPHILIAQCDGTSATETLHPNQVKTYMTCGGDLFWNREGEGYFVPSTLGTPSPSTIFASGIWLSGFDNDGNLKTACQRFGQAAGKSDYFPGPIDDVTEGPLPNGCTNFNHVWKVNRTEILLFLEDFNDNGAIDQPIPLGIQTWPARGNPYFAANMGFTLPDQDLAPFHDINDNGTFDPMDGEYPLVDPSWPDVIPDEITFSVFNDIQDFHKESGGEQLGVEVQLMGYGFNCLDNQLLGNTLFTRIVVKKKAEQPLNDVRMGFWTDTHMGCFIDDYIGFNEPLNTQYIYNADNNDNADCDFYASNEFGENPPVQTITFLNQSTSTFTYTFSPAFGEPAIPQTMPDGPVEFHHLMTGKWRDGIPFTFGGNGYDLSSTAEVNFAFPDLPSDPNGWSMQTAGIGDGFDFHTIQSFGPFDLNLGDEVTLDMAFSFHREPGASNLENVDIALEAIPSIQGIYDSGFTSTCTQFSLCENDCVWPGDVNADGIAKADDLLYLGLSIATGSGGPGREFQSSLWAPFESEDWTQDFFNGVNIKHADCDGNAQLNPIDKAYIEEHFNQTRPDYTGGLQEALVAPGQLYIEILKDSVSTLQNEFQRIVVAYVHFASEDEPFIDLSGVSFVIEYDTSLFQESSVGNPPYFVAEEAFPLYDPMFAGMDRMTIVEEDHATGHIHMATTTFGDLEDQGYGALAKFHLTLREDATTTNPDGKEFIGFKILDAWGANAFQEVIPLTYQSDVVCGINLTVDTTATAVEEKHEDVFSLDIFPNPNNGTFTLKVADASQSLSLSIFDLQGQMVWQGQTPGTTDAFSIELKNHLRSGMYLLKAMRDDGGFSTRKLLIK